MKNSLLKISFVFLITLLATFSLNAQEAIKVDEVTRLRCELGEVPGLYSLVPPLSANPEYKGVIIVYGPQKGFATRYAEQVRNWFNFVKVPKPERISSYYGGFREQPLMEFWAIPRGAKEPLINPIIQIKETSQFDKYTYEKFPYFGQNKEPSLKIFANELKQNPNFKGYIIGYGFKEKGSEEPPVYLNQLKHKLSKDKRFLTKLGVATSRIKTIIGGYDDIYPHAELWIVPEGAEPPKPTLPTKTASNFVKN